jgi:hypothetical protein
MVMNASALPLVLAVLRPPRASTQPRRLGELHLFLDAHPQASPAGGHADSLLPGFLPQYA